MSKWQQVKLGELYDVHNGLSKSRDAFGSGYPFLSFSEVFNNYFLPQELKQLVESTQKEQDSYSIHRGDVFITRTSETMDELGMSCVALHDYPNATYNGFTKRLRPKYPDRVLPEYIGYFLRTPLFRSKFVAFSTMTTRASLRNEDLLTMDVTLPPIEVQRKIADVLSAYDDLIENNRKQIKLLEEAARRLYKEWFIDLRFPGYENTKIINGIPEGWEKVQLCELIAFNPKITATNDTIKTFIPMEALSTSSMVISTAAVSETSKNAGSKFEIGDTLLARITPCLENGKTAFVSDIDKGVYGVGSTEFIVLRSKKLNPYIVYLLARTEEFRNYAINSMTGSDGRQRVKVDKLEMYSTLLPSRKIIDSFEQIVAPYFEKVKVLSKAVNSCQEARDYLLPKLMTGELEMK